MSATDEELKFVHEQEMCHVTYILDMFRYLHSVVVFLIHFHSTTGRNAPSRVAVDDANIETTNGVGRPTWYARVPSAEASASRAHVIGDGDRLVTWTSKNRPLYHLSG